MADGDNKHTQVLNDLASFYASTGDFDFTPPVSPVKVTPPTSDSEQDPPAVPSDDAGQQQQQHNTVFNNIKSQDIGITTRRRKGNPHNARKQSSLAAAVKPASSAPSSTSSSTSASHQQEHQQRPRRRPTALNKMDSSSHSTARRGPRRSKSSDGMLGGSSHHTRSSSTNAAAAVVDMEVPLKGGDEDDEGGMSALEKLKRRSTSKSVGRNKTRTAPERSRSDELVEMDRSRRGSSRDAHRRRPAARRTTQGEGGLEGDAAQIEDPDLVIDEDLREKVAEAMAKGGQVLVVETEVPLKDGEDDGDARKRSASRERRRRAPGRSKSDDLVEMDRSRRGSGGSGGAANRRRRNTQGEDKLAEDAGKIEDPDQVDDDDLKAMIDRAVLAEKVDGSLPAVESSQRSERTSTNGRKSSSTQQSRNSLRGSRGVDDIVIDIETKPSSGSTIKSEEPEFDPEAQRDDDKRSGHHSNRRSHRSGASSTTSKDAHSTNDSSTSSRSRPSRSRGGNSKWSAMKERSISRSKSIEHPTRAEGVQTNSLPRQNSEVMRKSEGLPRGLENPDFATSDRGLGKGQDDYQTSAVEPASHLPSSCNADKKADVPIANEPTKPKSTIFQSLLGKSMLKKKQASNEAVSKDDTTKSLEPSPKSDVQDQAPQPTSNRSLTRGNSDSSVSDKGENPNIVASNEEEGKESKKSASTMFKGLRNKGMGKKKASNEAASKDDTTKSLEPSPKSDVQDQAPQPTSNRSLTRGNSDSSVSDKGENPNVVASNEEEGKESKKSASTMFKGLLNKGMGKKNTPRESSKEDTATSLESLSTATEGKTELQSVEKPDSKQGSRWKGLKGGMDFTSKLMKAAAEKPKKNLAALVGKRGADTNGSIAKKTDDDPSTQAEPSDVFLRALGAVIKKEEDPAREVPMEHDLMMSVGSFSADAIEGLDEIYAQSTQEEENETDRSDEEDEAVDDAMKPSAKMTEATLQPDGPDLLFSILEGSAPAPVVLAAPVADRRSMMAGLAAPSMRFDFDRSAEVVVNRSQPAIVEEDEEEDESEDEGRDEMMGDESAEDNQVYGTLEEEPESDVDAPEGVNHVEQSESDSDSESSGFLSPMKFMQLKFKPSLSPSAGLGIAIRTLDDETHTEDDIMKVHQMREEELDFKVEALEVSSGPIASATSQSVPNADMGLRHQIIAQRKEKGPSALEIEFENLRREILASTIRTKAAREAVARFQEEISRKRKLYDEAERRRHDSLEALKDRNIRIDTPQGS